MAYINITMQELVSLFKQNGNYNTERIKEISVISKTQLQLTVNIGQFFPNINIGLIFNRFEKGKIIFNVMTTGGIKMIMGLINEMSRNIPNNCISIEGKNLVFDINKQLLISMKGVIIKDMNVAEDQIYITAHIDDH